MTTILAMKTPNGLLAPLPQYADRLERLHPQDVVSLTVKKLRNPHNHRRFFALLQVVAEYSDTYNHVEKAKPAVIIMAGWCDFSPNPFNPAELIPIPRSISFENMDELEFQQFFSAAIQGVIDHVAPFLTQANMQNLLNELMNF